MSEYIINTSQIEEINRAYGGMKTVTSWLSCYAIWDTSTFPMAMKSEHIAVTLPEIVRCRDCRYARAEPPSDRRSRKKYQGGYWCEKLSEGIGLFCESDDYCSWAIERQTNDRVHH